MLTFEKIRDLERAERENKKLQKLPDNMMEEMKEYLRKKEKTTDSSDIIELENIKSTIKRFFEAREQKIMEVVLYSLRTGLPPENLTKTEESVFNQMLVSAKKYREDFFSELQKPAEEKKTVYRVKKALPTFVGPDMKEYTLKENDMLEESSLPKPLNDLLLKEGVIERVEE